MTGKIIHMYNQKVCLMFTECGSFLFHMIRDKLDHQVTAKETSSSSSSDKVWASPEEHSLVSALATSSPEAVEDNSAEEKTNR